jgi:hypothetical protein
MATLSLGFTSSWEAYQQVALGHRADMNGTFVFPPRPSDGYALSHGLYSGYKLGLRPINRVLWEGAAMYFNAEYIAEVMMPKCLLELAKGGKP